MDGCCARWFTGYPALYLLQRAVAPGGGEGVGQDRAEISIHQGDGPCPLQNHKSFDVQAFALRQVAQLEVFLPPLATSEVGGQDEGEQDCERDHFQTVSSGMP